MLKQFCILFFLIVTTHMIGQYNPGYYALKDVNLINGISQAVQSHQTIIIRNKYIEAVGAVNKIIIPDSAIVFNYPGMYLIPGLIDSHVHLATEPTVEDNRERAERDLHDMLLKGITTVRDMAGDARALSGLSRDAFLGSIVSPDIYYAALMAGPAFFKDPRTHQSSQGGNAGEMAYMRAVTNTSNIPLVVAEAKGTGAQAIKLYAQLDGMMAKKITDEAHKQHLQVWSHTDLTIASPQEVIDAGVNSISHVSMFAKWPLKKIPPEWLKPELSKIFWDEAFKTLPVNNYIHSMLAHHTVLDATLLVTKSRLDDPTYPDSIKAILQAQWQIGKRFAKLALDNGVPVCAGTDSDEKKFVHREIKLLVTEAGFTPMEAIISATRQGAMAIGIEDKTGTIMVGKRANMVLLEQDPTIDISNLEMIRLVIKNGKLYNTD